MNILLVGATGQIGYALALKSAKSKHHVRVLVRDKHKLPFPDHVELLEAQQFTEEAYKRALDGVDLAIYGVGLPEQFTLDHNIFERINYGLFVKFLSAVSQSNIKQLIYISTYEVFAGIDRMIRESHPVADASQVSPYFQAMIKAYQTAQAFAAEHDLMLTTIHPAAVYGGLNTGDGFTGYLEKLLSNNRLQMPLIINGRFPLVHVDSLADAIIRSFNHPGAFLVSDEMTSLREIAVLLRQRTGQQSFVPATAPLWLVRPNATLLEIVGKLFRTRPMIAHAQIDFIINGREPLTEKAQQVLKWTPLPLSDGLARYLSDRANIPKVNDKLHGG